MVNQSLIDIFTGVAMLLVLGLGAFTLFLFASNERARAAWSKLGEENKRLLCEIDENKCTDGGRSLKRERNKLKGEKGKLIIALKRCTGRVKRLQKQKDELSSIIKPRSRRIVKK